MDPRWLWTDDGRTVNYCLTAVNVPHIKHPSFDFFLLLQRRKKYFYYIPREAGDSSESNFCLSEDWLSTEILI